jgi:ribosomal protein S18 acetylase RimI-like enzyme
VVTVRPAREDDLDAVSMLTVEAYTQDGYISADYDYINVLANARARYADGGLWVAELADAIVGTVKFAPYGSAYAEISKPGEAEFRMLGVSSAARRHGVGMALVQQCTDLAYQMGSPVLRLCTQPERVAAIALYERLGFVRTEDLDWMPEPGVQLIAYALDLRAHDDGARDLEPPRYCGVCGRRMVVQVTPHGWTAHCSVHGTRRG